MVWDSMKSFLVFGAVVGIGLMVKERVWVLDRKSPQEVGVQRLKICGLTVAFLCLGLWLFLPSALNLDDLVAGRPSTDAVSQERLLQDFRKMNDLLGNILLAVRWALFGVGCWISWNTWFLVRFNPSDSQGKKKAESQEAAA